MNIIKFFFAPERNTQMVNFNPCHKLKCQVYVTETEGVVHTEEFSFKFNLLCSNFNGYQN